jgi:hypothetical protein
MTLYLVHGNTCFSGYGYEGHVFGIFTDEETAENARDVFANDIYKIETLKDYSNVSTPHDVALQIRIEEIEADKIEDICLGGYME